MGEEPRDYYPHFKDFNFTACRMIIWLRMIHLSGHTKNHSFKGRHVCW